VTAGEAMHHLERRRLQLMEERRAVEDACEECGLQLAQLRQQRAAQELELASLARALDALRRDDLGDAREAV
jgi:septal ring factor EnvC (AmiA/AmiB activator)